MSIIHSRIPETLSPPLVIGNPWRLSDDGGVTPNREINNITFGLAFTSNSRGGMRINVGANTDASPYWEGNGEGGLQLRISQNPS